MALPLASVQLYTLAAEFSADMNGSLDKLAGIGLKNVRERLRLRYNGDANLSVIANFPAGVAATITVPANAQQRSSSHV